MDDLQVGGYLIPEAELDESFETYGGPGGQHANRNQTAVRLRFEIADSSLPADVRSKLTARIGQYAEVTASDSRSQFRNRAIARERLKEKLEKALVDPPRRRETKPSKASKERRLEEKKARSDTKRLRQAPRDGD
jgi:ribosome-associated protein